MTAATLTIPLAPTFAALPGPPRQVIDGLADRGFRFVQLSATQRGMRPRDLDHSARRDLLATLRRRELAVAGVDLWIPPEHFLDPTTMDRAVSATMAAIELAADLGRVALSLELPSPKDMQSLDEVVETIATASSKHGVPVADHAVPPLQRGSDAIGIGIDAAAWLAAGSDPSAGVSRWSDRLAAVRLSDLDTSGMRCPAGQSNGRLDVMAFRAAISISGRSGPVVVDARQWRDPWSGIALAAGAWQSSMSIP